MTVDEDTAFVGNKKEDFSLFSKGADVLRDDMKYFGASGCCRLTSF